MRLRVYHTQTQVGGDAGLNIAIVRCGGDGLEYKTNFTLAVKRDEGDILQRSVATL